MKIKFFATGKVCEVDTLGVFAPHPKQVESLSAGEVGFITAAIKEVRDTKVGDTIMDAMNPAKSLFRDTRF